MGMAAPQIHTHYPRLSQDQRDKGMMQCAECGAIFHKDAKFHRVAYGRGDTSGRYTHVADCDNTKCPFCGTSRDDHEPRYCTTVI